MGSEALRSLLALKREYKAPWPMLDRAIADIKAEDAERAAQANTPEAYEGKEQWVRTIFRTEMAEVLRQFITTEPDSLYAKALDLIGLLDPPAPKSQIIADRPCDLDHGVRIDPEPPLGPGDTFRHRELGFLGAAICVTDQLVYFGNMRSAWLRDLTRVALAEIKPGMAVECLHLSSPSLQGVVSRVKNGSYRVILWDGGKMDYDRSELRLLKAPEEGKA